MFDTKWESWFAGVTFPNPEDSKRTMKGAKDTAELVQDMVQYADEDSEAKAEKAARTIEQEIEGAFGDMSDLVEEHVARLNDADEAYNDLVEDLSFFLNKFKAVQLNDIPHPTKEIKEWCAEQLKGDYDFLIMEKKFLVLVMFDEKDRLHFKMRFG